MQLSYTAVNLEVATLAAVLEATFKSTILSSIQDAWDKLKTWIKNKIQNNTFVQYLQSKLTKIQRLKTWLANKLKKKKDYAPLVDEYQAEIDGELNVDSIDDSPLFQ